MTVAHDAETRFPATDTTGFSTAAGLLTFTHSPTSATPRGAVVVICATGTAAPCTGVTYGNVAMTLVTSAVDATETGVVYVYALGSGLPVGGVTVALENATTATKWVTCSTVTAGADTEISAFGKVDTTTSINPAVALTPVLDAMIYGAVHGGAAAPTSYVPVTSYQTQFNADYGALSARSARSQSRWLSDSTSFGFTFATSDDWCIAAVAIREAAAASPGFVRQFRTLRALLPR